jgi:sulfatase modifying factor 1
MKRWAFVLAAATVAAFSVIDCVGDGGGLVDDGGADADLTGTIRHACYANGTCNVGLACVSGVCVELDGGGADATLSNDAGDAGDPGDASASDAVADASVVLPPSCEPGGAGMTNCGAGNESCCTSIEVEGGTFNRTYAADGGGPSDAGDPATVSAFRLDKYDVTVGRFRQFVEAVLPADGGAGWMPAIGSGKHAYLNGGKGLVNSASDAGTVYETGWTATYASSVSPTNTNLQTSSYTAGPCTWTPSPGNQENLPINCVTWAEAYAFCIWDGGFLPTEAEWAYVAGAGSEEREYAWGQTPPGTTNKYAIYSCYYPSNAGTCSGVGTLANIAPVGTATSGASKWGHLDLNGELAQYNMDYIGPWGGGAPATPPYVTPCTDCMYEYMSGTTRYVFRGGGFDGPAPATSSLRNGDWPARSFGIGFRCAQAP